MRSGSASTMGRKISARRRECCPMIGAGYAPPPRWPAGACGRSADRPGRGTARPGSLRPPRTTPTTRHSHASRCPGHAPRPAATHRRSWTGATADASAHPDPGRQIHPQPTARRHARGDRTQPSRRKAPGRQDQAAQHLGDGLLPLRSDTPAGLQPWSDLGSLLDADIVWCAGDRLTRNPPSEQLPSIFPAAAKVGGAASQMP
jgi:hypothetical protein